MKVSYVKGGIGLASVLLLAVGIGTASAKDTWILLSEKTVKSTDPSTEIKAEEGKMWKEDVKRAKLSVEGADVETIPNVGVVKAGGETAAKDAPTREATLLSVSVQYKILNDKPNATIKVWGYD